MVFIQVTERTKTKGEIHKQKGDSMTPILARSRKTVAAILLIGSLLLLSVAGGIVYTLAGSNPGIMGNGTDGIEINIYGPAYQNLAKRTSNAYGRGGCTWFAGARASELTGMDLGLHSPKNWYNNVAQTYGFTKSSKPVAKSFAIFSNHMVVVERVSGDTLTISEGSNPGASDSAHGYCAIRKLSRSTLESGSYKGQSFLGYLDLHVSSDNAPTYDSKPASPNAVYVAQGRVDGQWHAYRGEDVARDYTGIALGRFGWWRVVNGDVQFGVKGVYQNELGWWYVNDGRVDFSHSGVENNVHGWWKITNGAVDFGFTGIASNEHGTWYLENGKVDFSKNDKVVFDDAAYLVENGRAARLSEQPKQDA